METILNPSTIQWTMLMPLLVGGAALWFAPNLAPRGVLFAVPVDPEMRSGAVGRRAIREYRWAIAIALAIAVGLTTLSRAESTRGWMAGWGIVLITGLAAHYRQYRRFRPFAVQPSLAGAITFSPGEGLPVWVWTCLAVSLLLLAGTAFYLNANWDQIPDRWARHWDIQGRPNGWSKRTVKGVYGPLMIGAAAIALMAGIIAVTWFGARQRQAREQTIKIMAVSAVLQAVVFSGVALMPVLANGPPSPGFLAAVLLTPLLIILWSVKARGDAGAEPVEPTPNERWHWGVIYYNPDDAAIFVEKRDGFGYTVNFGNRLAWVVLAAMVLIGPAVMAFVYR
jgi:uncharacterized membrane protein